MLELTGNTRKLLHHVGEIGVFNYSQIEIGGFLWFLGPAFSGAPNHYHGHALNILVHGAKRWFLTPPPHARYGLKSGWEWYSQDYPQEKKQFKIYECMQYEAEVREQWSSFHCRGFAFCILFPKLTLRSLQVIYVPHSWGHAIVNTRASIGYAGEFKPHGAHGLPDSITNASGLQPGTGTQWEQSDKPAVARRRAYEYLMQSKSQFSVWDTRAWSDNPALGRDLL